MAWLESLGWGLLRAGIVVIAFAVIDRVLGITGTNYGAVFGGALAAAPWKRFSLFDQHEQGNKPRD